MRAWAELILSSVYLNELGRVNLISMSAVCIGFAVFFSLALGCGVFCEVVLLYYMTYVC